MRGSGIPYYYTEKWELSKNPADNKAGMIFWN